MSWDWWDMSHGWGLMVFISTHTPFLFVFRTAKTLQRAEGSPELTQEHISYAISLLGLPDGATPSPCTPHPPRPIPGTPEPLFLSPTTEIDLYDYMNKPDLELLRPRSPITLEISLTSEVSAGPVSKTNLTHVRSHHHRLSSRWRRSRQLRTAT